MSSIETGRPSRCPVNDSLLTSSRSIVTMPLNSVRGASNPANSKLPLLVCKCVVNSKLSQSRIGTLRSRLAVASPLTLMLSSCPPSISLMGLLMARSRNDSSVPLTNALSVSTGLRKLAISSLPFTISLPALIIRLRSEYSRIFSTTMSPLIISAAGHLGW